MKRFFFFFGGGVQTAEHKEFLMERGVFCSLLSFVSNEVIRDFFVVGMLYLIKGKK